MGQALHINGGLVSQIGTSVLNFQSADVVTALGTTLTLGGANAVTVQLGGTGTTALNIGTAAQAKTIQIGQGGGTPDTIELGTPLGAGATINLNGNVTVRGTQHVIGDTTFDEDITLGDAVGDAITLKGTFSCDVGRFNDIKLAANAGGVRQLYVADSAAGGTGVSILAGANSTVDGAGSSINLVPSAPNGAGTEYGKVYFGPAGNVDSDRAYMLLTNATASVDTAGLRYAGAANRWELNNETGGWLPIATGYGISTLGTAYQHLEMNAGGTAMVWVSDLTMPEGSTIKVVNGDNQGSINVNAQAAVTAGQDGGEAYFGGGAGSGNGAGGATYVQGGYTDTGTGGATYVEGGSTLSSGGVGGDVIVVGGNAWAVGTPGNVRLRGGVSGATYGAVYIGDTNTSRIQIGSATNGLEIVITAGSAELQAIAGGTGMIDLPQNFKINNTATNYATPGTGQVTAANLNTLTAGSGSNADALHTHAGLSASSVDLPVAVDGAAVNDVVYIAASDTITVAQANGATASRAAGVKVAANSVRVTGVATVVVENGVTVAAGDDLFLSATGPGDVTNVAPSTSGQYITYVGQAKTGATGPATCTMYVRCERPIAL